MERHHDGRRRGRGRRQPPDALQRVRTRAEFAQAAVAREGERFLAAAQRTIEAHRDDPVDALSRAFAEFLAATSPQFSRREARALADCLVRLAISHAALPLHTPKRAASLVTGLLAPYLERAFQPSAA